MKSGEHITSEKLIFYKRPLFFSIIAFLISLVLFFVFLDFRFLILAFILIIISLSAIYFQCPNCKRLFTKTFIGIKDLGTISRENNILSETRVLYSNGKYKESEYNPKTVVEKIKMIRELYKCKFCGHIWFYDYKTQLNNIDNDTSTEKIDEKEPKECAICGKPLRTRRKYCSSCRPLGKIKFDENTV